MTALPGLPLPAPPAGPALVPDLDTPRGEAPLALLPRGTDGYRHEDNGFTADIAPDGTVRFDDRASVGLGGRTAEGEGRMFALDLTEVIMRAAGEDPYGADKASFLRRSRAFRAELCDRDRAETLQRSVLELRRLLDEVWAESGRSPVERRRLIFELWDDCAEDGVEDVRAAARTARAIIVGFVAERMPPGHPDAFPDAELLALNEQRRSRGRFEPYGKPMPPDAGSDTTVR